MMGRCSCLIRGMNLVMKEMVDQGKEEGVDVGEQEAEDEASLIISIQEHLLKPVFH